MNRKNIEEGPPLLPKAWIDNELNQRKLVEEVLHESHIQS